MPVHCRPDFCRQIGRKGQNFPDLIAIVHRHEAAAGAVVSAVPIR
jgi:hypothetical protein